MRGKKCLLINMTVAYLDKAPVIGATSNTGQLQQYCMATIWKTPTELPNGVPYIEADSQTYIHLSAFGFESHPCTADISI